MGLASFVGRPTTRNLDALLEHLEQVKGKAQEHIERDREMLLLSRELVTTGAEAPLEGSVGELEPPAPDQERLLDLCPAKSCVGMGCDYDQHPVWSNKECGEADLVTFKLETSRRRHLSEASTIDQLAAAIAEQIPAATDIVVTAVDGGYSVTFTLYGEVSSSIAAVSDPSFATAVSDATNIAFEPVAADSVAQETIITLPPPFPRAA